jgi:LPS-assembly protein
MRRGLVSTISLMALLLLASPAARAQLGGLTTGANGEQPISKTQPVTFTADQVTYDRDSGIVTATGHVEAWQNDHVLRADKITFDRNTDIAAASGHVVLTEPNGQVMFSDYAELSEGMKDGVLRGMRGVLEQNGRVVANGARRINGEVNEFTKLVYSTCNLCATDPTKPPLWQLRAYSAVQDVPNKRIEYYDAVMEMDGVPVFWLPYFNHADPSVKRASGLLVPSVGYNSHLGAFTSIPVYFVLDDQSDVTFTSVLSSTNGGNLDIDYRRKFNDGTLKLNLSGGNVEDAPAGQRNGFQGAVYGSGRFSLDDTWRYGFDIDRVSSIQYLTDYQLSRFVGGYNTTLTSDIYLEGFGDGSYSRIDAKAYQQVGTKLYQTTLPLVLPRYYYNFVGDVDRLGGRFSLETQDYNVVRTDGASDDRASLSLNYSRPFSDYYGGQWKLQFHADSAAYHGYNLTELPDYAQIAHIDTERAQPQVALDWREPLLRNSTNWGQQLIEPMAEVVAGPNISAKQWFKIPNEDSLDAELSDQNLFGFNRYPGLDRMEGGTRVNYALHAAWYLNGTTFDGLFGQSYMTNPDPYAPLGSGFGGPTGIYKVVYGNVVYTPSGKRPSATSDYVSRASFNPTSWMDVTARARFDRSSFDINSADAIASFNTKPVNFSFGYLYSKYNPYYLYDQQLITSNTFNGQNYESYPASYFTHRNEISANVGTHYDKYRFTASARYEIGTGKPVTAGTDAIYEDECFIFDAHVDRRFTSIDNDGGSTTVLFTVTFKTVGTFGYHAF